jgi:hypothetical protein
MVWAALSNCSFHVEIMVPYFNFNPNNMILVSLCATLSTLGIKTCNKIKTSISHFLLIDCAEQYHYVIMMGDRMEIEEEE